jgi:hypothetical protein
MLFLKFGAKIRVGDLKAAIFAHSVEDFFSCPFHPFIDGLLTQVT